PNNSPWLLDCQFEDELYNAGRGASPNLETGSETYANGMTGRALNFDGNTGYDIPNSQNWASNDFTFDVVVYIDESGLNRFLNIFSNYWNSDDGQQWTVPCVELLYQGDHQEMPRKFRLYMRHANGGSVNDMWSLNAVDDPGWYKLTVRRTDGLLQFFVDGNFQDEVQYNGDPQNGYPLHIGMSANVNKDNKLCGKIEYARISNQAISDEDLFGDLAFGLPFYDDFENGLYRWIQWGDAGNDALIFEDPVFECNYSVGMFSNENVPPYLQNDSMLRHYFDAVQGVHVSTWFNMERYGIGDNPGSWGAGCAAQVSIGNRIDGHLTIAVNDDGRVRWIPARGSHDYDNYLSDLRLDLNTWYQYDIYYVDGILSVTVRDEQGEVLIHGTADCLDMDIEYTDIGSFALSDDGYSYFDNFSIEECDQVPEPQISIEPETINFGEADYWTLSPDHIEIRNDGNADLSISNIVATGESFEVDFPGQFDLAPGASRTIVVTFTPQEIGEINGLLTISSNDPNVQDISINLCGEGIPSHSHRIVEIGGDLWGIVFTPDGNTAYVNDEHGGLVIPINAETEEAQEPIEVEELARMSAITSDGHNVFVSCGPDYVYKIRTSDNTVSERIFVDSDPMGMVVAPGDQYLYVARWTNNDVAVVDLSNNQIVSIIELATRPEYVVLHPNGDELWVTCNYGNSVYRINLQTNQVLGNPIEVNLPHGLALSSDGQFAYVTMPESDQVSVISTNDRQVLRTIDVGDQPRGVLSYGEYFYVTNRGDGTVQKISKDDFSISETYTVGGHPHYIALRPGTNTAYISIGVDGPIHILELEEPPQQPQISIVPEAIDFGDVDYWSPVTAQIEISNDGNAELTVTNIVTTGESFEVDFPGQFDLAPGESRQIEITFTPREFGEISGVLMVNSNDPIDEEVVINLLGTGIGDDVNRAVDTQDSAYAVIPDHDSYHFGTGDFTVEAMIWIEEFNGLESQIVTKSLGGNFFWLRVATLNGPGPISFGTGELNVNEESLLSTTHFETGRWYHIAGVRSENTLTMYVNGEEDATGEFGVINIDNNNSIYIGNSHALDDNFNGIIDEVRMWNAPRSPQEIADNAFEQLIGDEESIVGLWQLNEGIGNRINDSSPTGNHGELFLDYEWIDVDWHLPIPEIEVIPPEAHFGEVEVGDDTMIPLMIYNRGRENLNITNISKNLEEFRVEFYEEFTILPDSSRRLTVEFYPVSRDTLLDTISIASNDPNTPEILIPLSGTGVAAEVQFSPQTIDFGQVDVGDGLPQNLTVSNTGT
ncbi:MAG: choice-of-anchor D domain-containing protein, partial [Calditrichaeota bacterium]|nr:choice-of-anchor D domain-containing protein [Calditrichota bacterium]